MRTTISLLLVALLFTGCNSVKRNQKLITSGNYEQAIFLAIKKIGNDRNARQSDQHKILLQKAFNKFVDREQRRIRFLKKEQTLQSKLNVYDAYVNLENIQESIRPLLPLVNSQNGKTLKMDIRDYTSSMLQAKSVAADALFDTADRLLKRNDKMDARQAYGYLTRLKDLRQNDGRVDQMIDDAIFIGTDFIHVTLNNRSGQIMPRRLERELLDFNTYGLDDFWTQYHVERNPQIDYDYGIALNFRIINFSPERIREFEERRTKRIVVESVVERDSRGEILKDEDGNPRKKETYETVSAMMYITEQTKAAYVEGNVVYRDLVTRRDINRFPLATEFIFENAFATFTGDERALSPDDKVLIGNGFIPFPSNAQLLLDAGDDIKNRLKIILTEEL